MLKLSAWRKYLCFFFVYIIVNTPSFSQSETKELETIQDLILKTQENLEKKLKDSERIREELKLAELRIAETATQLNNTDKELIEVRTKKEALEAEKNTLSQKIKGQQSALATQIKSAYMAGDYDFAKMIFHQDEASKFERILTYYKYLNAARQEQIEQFRFLVSSLENVEVELDQQAQELSRLLDLQSSQSKTLIGQQQSRFEKLRELEGEIESEQERVKQLQDQENDLLAAIEQAEREAEKAQKNRETQDLKGLAQIKGQLLTPAQGRLRSLFGKRRQGQVRWKGIVIESRAGSNVVAVADGVVLYSDWLKGFGLVTILDHGKGYMSVYGRNQALLKNVGDYVFANESIGLVGNSGGQSRASLYFEIRHKGKALNPIAWLAK